MGIEVTETPDDDGEELYEEQSALEQAMTSRGTPERRYVFDRWEYS